MQTAADIKKAEKQAKKDAQKKKDDERKAKEQAELVQEFEDKKAKAGAAGDATGKLKAWLEKPPYKCTNADVKVREKNGVINK